MSEGCPCVTVLHLLQDFMRISIESSQFELLARWGEEHECRHISTTVTLLLDILREVTGKPPAYAELRNRPPRGRPIRQLGSVYFGREIQITQLSLSSRTRALWIWGSSKGCTSIAESMRYLIGLLVEAYPGLDIGVSNEHMELECLYCFRDLILGEPVAEIFEKYRP